MIYIIKLQLQHCKIYTILSPLSALNCKRISLKMSMHGKVKSWNLSFIPHLKCRKLIRNKNPI